MKEKIPVPGGWLHPQARRGEDSPPPEEVQVRVRGAVEGPLHGRLHVDGAREAHEVRLEKYMNRVDEREAAAARASTPAPSRRRRREAPRRLRPRRRVWHPQPHQGLSGGQKVKLVLGSAMWQQPHIVVMDEPTNYLDRDALGALACAVKEFDGGVLLITHNCEFADALKEETWEVPGDGKVYVTGNKWGQGKKGKGDASRRHPGRGRRRPRQRRQGEGPQEALPQGDQGQGQGARRQACRGPGPHHRLRLGPRRVHRRARRRRPRPDEAMISCILRTPVHLWRLP